MSEGTWAKAIMNIIIFIAIICAIVFDGRIASRQNQEVAVEFLTEPNDNGTLIISRETNIKPEGVMDWESYLLEAATDVNELKHAGFEQVKIYTSLSVYGFDYKLIILN